MSDFTEDFIFKEFLPRVPAKSILGFKSVSKSWLARIATDSAFIADHAAHHSATAAESSHIIHPAMCPSFDMLTTWFFLDPRGSTKQIDWEYSYLLADLLSKTQKECFAVTIAGSCKGLLCLHMWSFTETNDVVIWNPVTGEFKYLPEPTLPPLLAGDNWDDRRRECYLGIGDDINDYTVVRLEQVEGMSENVEAFFVVQLYTKSSGRWRQLNSFSGFTLLLGCLQGVTMDGAMHWAIRYGSPDHNPLFRVLSFDLCTEEFQEFGLPPCFRDFANMELVKWKGCLGALLVKPCRTQYEIWLRTIAHDHDDGDKNGDSFSWTMAICIVPASCEVNFGGIIGDRLFLRRMDDRKQFMYDLTSHETAELEVELSDGTFYNVFEHVHTLISPN